VENQTHTLNSTLNPVQKKNIHAIRNKITIKNNKSSLQQQNRSTGKSSQQKKIIFPTTPLFI